MNRKIKTALMLTLCFLLSASAAFASARDNMLDRVMIMHGQITEIEENKITLQNKNDASDKIDLIVNWKTEILNGRNGDDVDFSRLSAGDELTAYYSPISTRSIPPQSAAYALVMGSGEHDGIYMKVAQTEKTKRGVRILNTNEDTYVTIPEDVNDDADKLKKGDSVLVWYDFVALSMPGQATAVKAVMLD